MNERCQHEGCDFADEPNHPIHDMGRGVFAQPGLPRHPFELPVDDKEHKDG